jgi:hypothetical protein
VRPLSVLSMPPALFALLATASAAAFEVEQQFDGVTMEQVVAALHQQCFEAGMTVEMPSDSAVQCSAIVSDDDDLPADVRIGRVHDGHVAHHLGFSLATRGDGVRVWMNAWLAIVEPDGATLEEDLDSALYAQRVQRLLAQLADGLPAEQDQVSAPGGATALWSAHYDSEFDWRLDAHLRAVRHCDQRLEDLDAAAIDAALRMIGLVPLGSALRDRCEALYEVIYEWGLARGTEQPAREDFFAYRDAQPAGERICFGRLALANRCDGGRD